MAQLAAQLWKIVERVPSQHFRVRAGADHQRRRFNELVDDAELVEQLKQQLATTDTALDDDYDSFEMLEQPEMAEVAETSFFKT